MSNNYFEFKQFRIYQDGAAMKVGTDGVLLGAWADFNGAEQHILDIGTGTGLLALMAAQRTSQARIHAIEIDKQAYLQAQENIEISNWNHRIEIHSSSIQDFTQQTGFLYDHILSNPPFFVDSLKAPDASRSTARHTDTLPFQDLLACVIQLLKPTGYFSVIYPVAEAAVFEEKAASIELHCNRKTFVRGNTNSPAKRVLMEFSRQRKDIQENELVIESGRHQYTEEYKALTKDFYLKF